MRALVLDEVSRQPSPYGAGLPLVLGGQSGPRPAGIGIRLVVTDVTDRLGQTHLPLAAERALPPFPVALFPVERGLPALRLDRVPAQRQPQFRTGIAAVAHEFQVFAAGDQPRGETKRPQEHLMAWRLVV